MKPGEIAEFGIWLSGEETEEQLHNWKTIEVPKIIERTEKQFNVVLKNIRFIVKSPGEDRVPQVPKHIKGANVKLLISEADVFAGPQAIKMQKGIANDLDQKSLQTLRRITRREHSKAHPGMPALNNQQCDAVINRLGTEIIVQMLNGKAIH